MLKLCIALLAVAAMAPGPALATSTGSLAFITRAPGAAFDTEVAMFNLSTGRVLPVARLPSSLESTIAVQSACLTSDNHYVFAMQYTQAQGVGRVIEIDLSSGKTIKSFNTSVVCLSLLCSGHSPTSVTCASESSDGGLSVSDIDLATEGPSKLTGSFGTGLAVSRLYSWDTLNTTLFTLLASPPRWPFSGIYLVKYDFGSNSGVVGNSTMEYGTGAWFMTSITASYGTQDDGSVQSTTSLAQFKLLATAEQLGTGDKAFGSFNFGEKQAGFTPCASVKLLDGYQQLDSVSAAANGFYFTTAFEKVSQGTRSGPPQLYLLVIDIAADEVAERFALESPMIDIQWVPPPLL